MSTIPARALALILLSSSLSACHHAVMPADQPQMTAPREIELRGWLTSITGDPPSGAPRLIFHLTDAAGETIQLEIPESVLSAAGGLLVLNNREVVVTTQAFSRNPSVPTRILSIRLAQ